ncbi:MAG: SpoVR family protein [Candidatus Bipolaricaulota bacterium]|nr:SpoVR family protein [Candidatus Bipolaricaulota bacterium]MCS7274277.1 SpoVR family protein [Candidatus Bipolaricaulota bacterium]MDW8111472.1 SpoVR family protein [Candidatus Bipolaricaulota bacterium]MDW8329385.1 SpoVR family protein [Candidatus Bipolaricaulota bacterium]
MNRRRVRELEAMRKEARRLAESVGLDPTPVIFGVVDYDQLNEYSAYDGFPERFPHWSFGMSYDYFRKRSAYSGWWTYELVLNTDPAIAFLRESNTPVENKGVMIHVYGHADFFKNNRWFSKTPKDMIKVMHTHAQRIEEYMNKYGVERVESFIDKALSIQYEIDQYAPFIKRRWREIPKNYEEEPPLEPKRIPVKRDYMDRFVNPPAWLEERRALLKQRYEEQARRLQEETELLQPQKDLLAFLIKYGRLEGWQKDILAMIREESLYFVPQMQTKIMNEGWAMLWQSKLMAEFATPEEFVDHADMVSKVLVGGVVNPYALGKLIWEDIKERWDKGRFGREWELCQDPEKKKRWDTKANLGTEKIFEVRRTYNDITFLADFFTEELFEKLKLFAYEYIPETGAYHITSRDFHDVKKKLLFQYTNLGRPVIKVATGNYGNKGELLLLHMYNGVGLNLEEAKEVLKNIYAMWGRPVNLKTIIKRKVKDPDPMRNRIHPERPLTAVYEEQGVLLRYDGESVRELALSSDEIEEIRLDEDYNTIPREWIG